MAKRNINKNSNNSESTPEKEEKIQDKEIEKLKEKEVQTQNSNNSESTPEKDEEADDSKTEFEFDYKKHNKYVVRQWKKNEDYYNKLDTHEEKQIKFNKFINEVIRK
jgi:hypothetical protein